MASLMKISQRAASTFLRPQSARAMSSYTYVKSEEDADVIIKGTGGLDTSAFPAYDSLARDVAVDMMAQAEANGVEKIVIPKQAESLEWVLSSPVPLHTFLEPPMIVSSSNSAGCKFINEGHHEH